MLLLLFLQLAFTQEIDLVWKLKYLNYKKDLNYQKKILVNFINADCTQCEEISKVYSEAAEILSKNAIRIAQVNCTEEAPLCEELGVDQFPSFKYFIDGKPNAYTGGTTVESLTSWVSNKHNTIYFQLPNPGHIHHYAGINRQTLVYFGVPTAEHKEMLESFSFLYHYILFIENPFAETLEKFNTTDHSIILFKGGDEIHYEGEIESESLKAFLDAQGYAPVYQLNDYSIEAVFKNQSTGFFLFRPQANRNDYLNILGKVADKFEGQMVFIETDLSAKGPQKRIGGALGISVDQQPLAVIYNSSGLLKYRTAGLSFEELVNFITSYFSGSLTPYYKSQPIPEIDTDNGVKVVVGLNFKNITQDPDKNILMLYYAEDHPNCTKFMPIYEKIAEEYTEKGYVVGKMDIVYNEATDLAIPFVPLLTFSPVGFTYDMVHDGEMTLKAVEKFIKRVLLRISLDL
jgi:protein disulfide isomerase